MKIIASNIIIIALICSLCVIVQGQSIFKCSPSTGDLDTFSFNVGSNNGVACVTRRKNHTKKILLYIDTMSPSGGRKIAVAASKYDKSQGLYTGNFYRLYPPGPKRPFTMTISSGFIRINFANGKVIEMTQKPDGLAWVPADMRMLSGCANESPQLFMNLMDQTSMQNSKMMLCAMSSLSNGEFDALYGFGMRMSQTIGMEPFFFIGKAKPAIHPSAPINLTTKVMDICLRIDCKLCGPGFRSLTLSN